MTDHLTDELVAPALPSAHRVRFPVSRLIVDPERFPDDKDEPMSGVGMGVIYEKASHGATLRAAPAPAARQRLMQAYYFPHHAALDAAVSASIERHGCCAVLDMHSFPSQALPYELDQSGDRPDACIGTDPFHTPDELVDGLARGFSAAGLSVAIDRPFSGALVPARHYRKDRRVLSVMVEMNRRLYLDETTGKAAEQFFRIQRVLAGVLGDLAPLPVALAGPHAAR